MPLHFLQGDATQPRPGGLRIITHICNDVGGWGAGFVLALSRRWPEPEAAYRRWFRSQEGFALGAVQFVEVEPDLTVANIIGQHGTSARDGKPPIRYEAVRTGLEKVAARALERSASVHMPRMGAGLAGGRWEEIERIVRETLVEKGIEVTVYDLA